MTKNNAYGFQVDSIDNTFTFIDVTGLTTTNQLTVNGTTTIGGTLNQNAPIVITEAIDNAGLSFNYHPDPGTFMCFRFLRDGVANAEIGMWDKTTNELYLQNLIGTDTVLLGAGEQLRIKNAGIASNAANYVFLALNGTTLEKHDVSTNFASLNIATTNLTATNITPPTNYLTLTKPIYFSNGFGDPLTGGKLFLYGNPASFQYFGQYVASGTLGNMIDSTAGNILFSAATGTATKYDIASILGNGGLFLTNANVTPSTPVGGATVFSAGGDIKTKNTAGYIVNLSNPDYVGEEYCDNGTTAMTLASGVGTDWYVVTMTSYNAGLLNWGFDIGTGTYAQLRYGGTTTRKTLVSCNLTFTSSNNNYTAGITMFLNPTFDVNGKILTGTRLNGSSYLKVGTAGDVNHFSVQGMALTPANSTIAVALSQNSGVSLTQTVTNFNLQATSLSAGTD